MNPADAFLEAFNKEYPQAKKGQLTLEEFQKFLVNFEEKIMLIVQGRWVRSQTWDDLT